MTLQHFILTRFNILLWRKDKSGSPVRSREWLEHRFSLFERFCLPSLMGYVVLHKVVDNSVWNLTIMLKFLETLLKRLLANVKRRKTNNYL